MIILYFEVNCGFLEFFHEMSHHRRTIASIVIRIILFMRL